MENAYPDKIGKYEVLAELGQGTMGRIYKAFDPFIKREVAIKTINKTISDAQQVSSDEIMARFKREAQAAGRLNHPNIVSIYEYIENSDAAFIVMEIVNGRELSSYFDHQEKFIHIEHIVFIMEQLLDALSHSHKHGVIHRDIKPANIIVMANYQIKVADFGIANMEYSDLTQLGAIMGTPAYMSPEQVRGEKTGHLSDLFSAGVIFYQLLTGEKPFYAQSITATMHKVLHETPIQPTLLNSQIPASFDGIVQKALSKRPEARYHSADDFKRAILSAPIKNSYSELSSSELSASHISVYPDSLSHGAENHTNNGQTVLVNRSLETTQLLDRDAIQRDASIQREIADRFSKTETQLAVNELFLKNRGGSVFSKIFILCICVIMSVFAYQYISKEKTDRLLHQDESTADHELTETEPEDTSTPLPPEEPVNTPTEPPQKVLPIGEPMKRPEVPEVRETKDLSEFLKQFEKKLSDEPNPKVENAN